MKTALVTTTINIPHVLHLYRRADPDVRFFIAIDNKTPDLKKFCDEISNAQWVSTGSESGDPWKCSPLIGWNCIQRRNIATLEALRWGADIIVFVDDDNIPVDPVNYFAWYRSNLSELTPFVPDTPRGYQERHWSGLLASPEVDWFDVGAFLDPPASHRGFPHQFAHRKPRLSHVVDARIGACAGIVLGDPDISAITRIARAPHVLSVSPLLNAGIAVNPKFTRTVWNTQNSAVIRDLAPAMLLCPQFKRYDDIIASLVCQRVMADTGHHVLFGPPFVYQERNIQSLSKNLEDEAWGQAHILDVQAALWRTVTSHSTDICGTVQKLYDALDILMPGVGALAEAWIKDCRSAMG